MPLPAEEFASYDLSNVSNSQLILNSLVVPRPVAFVTSQGENGVLNAAPYSYFSIVTGRPPIVSLAIQQKEGGVYKDTARNIFFSKEFVINICGIGMAKAISVASGEFPPETSEVELTHLSLFPSRKIRVPRIANTSAQMECVLEHSIYIEEGRVDIILGRVIMVHLHEKVLNQNGQIDFNKLAPLARMGGHTFGKVDNYFDVPRGL